MMSLDAFSELEVCYNAFAAGAVPGIRCGNLQHSRDSLAAFRGRGGQGGTGKGRRSGEGRKGGKMGEDVQC